jgi:hypothetical protein
VYFRQKAGGKRSLTVASRIDSALPLILCRAPSVFPVTRWDDKVTMSSEQWTCATKGAQHREEAPWGRWWR